jgi:lipopolysaccharide transport system ATP-binding protein
MNQVPVIRAEGLSKEYVIGGFRHDTLREQLTEGIKALTGRNHRNSTTTFWALNDVSFEVHQGEVVGLIGRNGAGKSTLLKILARITEPTRGFADIRGRVSSLLEVGTGFHPELTGRENIYLNGAVLGMPKQEIDRKRDDIVEFAGVEKFIDMPVKRYSSGMYVRLAFAIAAHLQPEILLVDEVLAVGDVEFRKRCLGKMGEVARGGRTVVFVSHNMGAIVQLCKRALWIHNGQLHLEGRADSVVSSYLRSFTPERSMWQSEDGAPGADFQFTAACITSMDGEPTGTVEFTNPFRVALEYRTRRPFKGLCIICGVSDSMGTTIWESWDSDPENWNHERVRDAGSYRSVCLVPAGFLRPGAYNLTISAYSPEQDLPLIENLLTFEVSEVGYHLNPRRPGMITPLMKWESARLDAAPAGQRS